MVALKTTRVNLEREVKHAQELLQETKELAHYAYQLPELKWAVEALKVLAVTAIETTSNAIPVTEGATEPTNEVITAAGGAIAKRMTRSGKQLEQTEDSASENPSETGPPRGQRLGFARGVPLDRGTISTS